jgi:2-polyprenyl-6-methoxyphenol hydroxylase-like FAD-dependent oxidoreductase
MPSKVQTRRQSDRVLEIVIVGAGLSSIGAAIECALSGHHVTLLESAPQLVEVGISFLGANLRAIRIRVADRFRLVRDYSSHPTRPRS